MDQRLQTVRQREAIAAVEIASPLECPGQLEGIESVAAAELMDPSEGRAAEIDAQDAGDDRGDVVDRQRADLDRGAAIRWNGRDESGDRDRRSVGPLGREQSDRRVLEPAEREFER